MVRGGGRGGGAGGAPEAVLRVGWEGSRWLGASARPEGVVAAHLLRIEIPRIVQPMYAAWRWSGMVPSLEPGP